MKSGVDTNLGISLLALLFFTAALGFFTYCRWSLNPRLSRLAIIYGVIFCLAGCVMVVLWVVTVSPPDR